MKEDNILVQATLFAYPEYKREIMRLKAKVEFLTGLSYATVGDHEPLDWFDRVNRCMKDAENVATLRNVVNTAVSNLDKEGKTIIKYAYFMRKQGRYICNKMGLEPAMYKYRKKRAVDKVQSYMKVLGMDNDRIIELFDDCELLIRWADHVEKLRLKTID